MGQIVSGSMHTPTTMMRQAWGAGRHTPSSTPRTPTASKMTRLRPLPIRVQALITKPSGGDGSDFSYPA